MAETKKTLRLTQVKSPIGRTPVDNESVRGMIFTVKHLITVEEI